MLTESIVRIGRPIVQGDLPNHERIRWLTDVDSENCKNFFQHVFLVELDGARTAFHLLQVGNGEGKGFQVDRLRNHAFPIIYPNGGNPLNAQGIYPVPCYLMYDPHIKAMKDGRSFAGEVLLPRLEKTVSYYSFDLEKRGEIAERVSRLLADHYEEFIKNEKQLGILYLFDHSLPIFHTMPERRKDSRYLWIAESKLKENMHLYLDGDEALAGIVEARFLEAKTLGHARNKISTFTNRREEEVASVYNKSWLWLSPTWEMPRSIYWDKNDWTRGIKIDRANYEAFLYGVQFLKQITVPISSALLKEMFSPISNAEAKKHMKPTSFEPIYGVPMVLPLTDGDSEQLYEKYRFIMQNDQEKSESDLHLELLAGINKVVPKMSDEYRLFLLYYSGDLSRGNMHVRMVIEDVVPTVASQIQTILKKVNRRDLSEIRRVFGVNSEREFYRTLTLPSLLSNAYGPGYIWSSLQSVFHRQPLTLDRIYRATAAKLNELANKEDHWGMMDELTFFYVFLSFFDQYHRDIVRKEKRVKLMNDWMELLNRYRAGEVKVDDLLSAEELGYVTGLLLKQFSQSYYQKTNKDFVKHRVMRFGSKLTPQLIWRNGVLRCKELADQWEMGLGGNFYQALPHVLLGFLNMEKQLASKGDRFMTAFWSGYLMYQKEKEGEK